MAAKFKSIQIVEIKSKIAAQPWRTYYVITSGPRWELFAHHGVNLPIGGVSQLTQVQTMSRTLNLSSPSADGQLRMPYRRLGVGEREERTILTYAFFVNRNHTSPSQQWPSHHMVTTFQVPVAVEVKNPSAICRDVDKRKKRKQILGVGERPYRY
ncbi:hypothetical protein K438DRAFT_1926217 [Mycena galopus ATCC 62051]|nr:hypothetical protein K438DRAFT_1926217 [Mycena galopus ATCC 62051]